MARLHKKETYFSPADVLTLPRHKRKLLNGKAGFKEPLVENKKEKTRKIIKILKRAKQETKIRKMNLQRPLQFLYLQLVQPQKMMLSFF